MSTVTIKPDGSTIIESGTGASVTLGADGSVVIRGGKLVKGDGKAPGIKLEYDLGPDFDATRRSIAMAVNRSSRDLAEKYAALPTPPQARKAPNLTKKAAAEVRKRFGVGGRQAGRKKR